MIDKIEGLYMIGEMVSERQKSRWEIPPTWPAGVPDGKHLSSYTSTNESSPCILEFFPCPSQRARCYSSPTRLDFPHSLTQVFVIHINQKVCSLKCPVVESANSISKEGRAAEPGGRVT